MELLVNILQLGGGVLLALGYLPQIIKTIKTKSVKDISPVFYLAISTGLLLEEIYALYTVFVNNSAHMFLVTNTLGLLCASTMLILTLIYRKK